MSLRVPPASPRCQSIGAHQQAPLRFAEIERVHDLRFAEYFRAELEELRRPGGLIALDIVRETAIGLVVPPEARPLVRNVCYVFDRRSHEAHVAAKQMSSAI